MRPLTLHLSALNDAEYRFYTTSFHDLLPNLPQENEVQSDGHYERLSVGVREVRAWLRGRYQDLSGNDIDTILRFFHPNLPWTDILSGGQFFAALRLVVHLESGKGVDASLAFIQATPDLTVTGRVSRHGPPLPTHPSATQSRAATSRKQPLLPPVPSPNPLHSHLYQPGNRLLAIQRSASTNIVTRNKNSNTLQIHDANSDSDIEVMDVKKAGNTVMVKRESDGTKVMTRVVETDDEDDQPETDDSVIVVSDVKKASALKRKERETDAVANGLRAVTGKCDRCRKYKRGQLCVYGMSDVKCQKCTTAKQGCFWGNVSRTGLRKILRPRKKVPAESSSH